MKKRLSAPYTKFFRRWLSWILVLFILCTILFVPFRGSSFAGRLVFGAIGTGVLLWSFIRINTLSIIYGDDEFLYINNFNTIYKIRYTEINKIWQSNDFYARIINIKFEQNGESKLIHFIGNFEIDYKAPHHPVISMIKEKMRPGLLETLYKQVLFFTENGQSSIEHPNFMMHETHKITGEPRNEVTELFVKFIEIGFLEKVPNEEYAYRVKVMMPVSEIETLINYE